MNEVQNNTPKEVRKHGVCPSLQGVQGPSDVMPDGCVAVFYTSRVMCKRGMTMEEMILSFKHYWRFVDSEVFELKALLWEMSGEVACTLAERIEGKAR